jgi:hypothetical protein
MVDLLPDLIVRSSIGMRLFARILTMFLALSLMGGAQACIAVCAPTAGRGAMREVKSCPHCPPRGSDKSSAPVSQLPCKLCQGAVQNRVADEGVSPVIFNLDLASFSTLPVIRGTMVSDARLGTRSLPSHGPPGELLHQVCVLLI